MSLNDGEIENRRRQVKIINNLMDINCPRSNNNAVVVRRFSERWWRWSDGPVTTVPRIITSNSRIKTKRNRLSGFFQAQLRMMKSLKKRKKKQKKKGKLSSNQIAAAASSTSTSSSSCLISKQLIGNCSKSKSNLINYQFTTSSSTCPILKRHRNIDRFNDLPKELLAEILVRLPVKYILRCRCVLKSWNYFIKSPVFIALHLNYQKQQIIAANHNHHYPKYLFFQYQYSFGLTLRFDHVQCEEYCRLEFLPGFPGHAWFVPSYGLICASTIFLSGPEYDRKIYLWNPLINKYKTLPKSPLPSRQNKWQAWEALAFGFLPQVDDYVVIHITKPCLLPHRHSVIIGVYSLSTNSWKKSSQDNVFISGISSEEDNVVFINGAAFWVGCDLNNQKILMCFDTKTDILSEISLPDSVDYPPSVPIIHAFGQSIAYFIWEDEVIHFDMWVLKYDHINEFTWEKKMCVTPSKDVGEDVLGVRNNGDPILAKSKHLISYNFDSHQASRFVSSWDRWTPHSPYKEGKGSPYVIKPFVESLVMLNND